MKKPPFEKEPEVFVEETPAEVPVAVEEQKPAPPPKNKECPVCNPKREMMRMNEGASWIVWGCAGCHLQQLENKFVYPQLEMRKRVL